MSDNRRYAIWAMQIADEADSEDVTTTVREALVDAGVPRFKAPLATGAVVVVTVPRGRQKEFNTMARMLDLEELVR